MDSILIEHSRVENILIFSSLKDLFFWKDNELRFFQSSIYRNYAIYLYNIKEGLEISYHETGQKYHIVRWKEKGRDGVEIWYQKMGKKKLVRNWKEGEQEGLETAYFNSGRKSYEKNWKNDQLEGNEIWYYESGQRKMELNWKAGKQEGLQRGTL